VSLSSLWSRTGQALVRFVEETRVPRPVQVFFGSIGQPILNLIDSNQPGRILRVPSLFMVVVEPAL